MSGHCHSTWSTDVLEPPVQAQRSHALLLLLNDNTYMHPTGHPIKVIKNTRNNLPC